MKIAVVFNEIPQAGGAFHQSIRAIEQFSRVCTGVCDVELFHSVGGGDVWLKELGLKSTRLRETWWSKIVEAVLRFAPKTLSRRLEIISPREKDLLARGVDLVYFASPNMLATFLNKLRYVTTLYDLCHRDFPEFPELSDFAAFESRDSYNQRTLAKAVLVVVDSDVLKTTVCKVYSVRDERVLVMPYGVSHYIANANSDGARLRSKYKLHEPFLFYPAQFWAHKNHVRIVQALHLLKQRGNRVNVAFAGGDPGNRTHVEAIVARLGLIDQVHFLGFIPSEDLAGLYSESLALIMPSYLGPTNIPPLEAWSRDVPVIYSKHLSAGIEDGVLAVDSDCSKSIASAIELVGVDNVRQGLIAGGRRCLERVQKDITAAEEEFRRHLLSFAKRRETWRPSRPQATS